MSEVGTSSPGRLIPLGEIVGTHGVGGLLRFHPYSDSAAALAAPCVVYLAPRPGRASTRRRHSEALGPPASARLLSARPHGRVLLLHVEGVATIEAAGAYVGTVLSIPERDLPAVDAGEYYAYQLQGLEVVTRAGDRLGTVDHLFPTGSNDVLVVRDGTREHLIPVIADVVRQVDLAHGTIVIEPIEGLLD